MAAAVEGWKSSGLIKVAGIPAPSGQYQVGCNDLMQEGGLLVRLFYPTNEGNGEYQYTPSRPHPKYTKALFEFLEEKGPGIKSSIINGLLSKLKIQLNFSLESVLTFRSKNSCFIWCTII